MARTGRPPVTRARVLTYWRKHGPCGIRELARLTGADRRHVQRMIRAAEKCGAMTFAAASSLSE
jgi:predicted transcriptional regulator